MSRERNTKPQPEEYDPESHMWVYNGRRFQHQERAELTYLRDLCAWQERIIQGLEGFYRSVDERHSED